MAKTKVLIVDRLAPAGLAALKGFDAIYEPEIGEPQLLEMLGDIHALVIRTRTLINRNLLAKAPKLKLIVRAGIGLDNIDIPACKKAGVVVKNTPKGNRVSTAEHTLGLILALARKIVQAKPAMQRGVWDRQTYMGMELMGKTLGIIGLGNIGSLVAQKALALDLKVIAYDPYIDRKLANKLRVALVKLPELLKQSHIVTFHVPLTDETRHMADAGFFNKMREKSFLINASRGAVVDGEALLDALNSGKLAGAALDVFEQEPPSAQSELLSHEQIIVTPHIAGQTVESLENISLEAAKTVVNFFKKK